MDLKIQNDLVESLKHEIKISEKEIVAITTENRSLVDNSIEINKEIEKSKLIVQKFQNDKSLVDSKIKINKDKMLTIRTGLNSKHKMLSLLKKSEEHTISATPVLSTNKHSMTKSASCITTFSNISINNSASKQSNLNNNLENVNLHELFKEDTTNDNNNTKEKVISGQKTVLNVNEPNPLSTTIENLASPSNNEKSSDLPPSTDNENKSDLTTASGNENISDVTIESGNEYMPDLTTATSNANNSDKLVENNANEPDINNNFNQNTAPPSKQPPVEKHAKTKVTPSGDPPGTHDSSYSNKKQPNKSGGKNNADDKCPQKRSSSQLGNDGENQNSKKNKI